MEQLIMMSLQTCQTYAEKSHAQALTEDEALLYRHVCRMCQVHAQVQEMIFKAQEMQWERQLQEQRREHQKWLEEQCPKPGQED